MCIFIRIISASAIEADKHLDHISEKYERVKEEDPFVVTMLLTHDRYHKLMDKMKEEVINFMSQEPECEYSSEHQTDIDEWENKYPFTVSIMALPPLVAFRDDINSIKKID